MVVDDIMEIPRLAEPQTDQRCLFKPLSLPKIINDKLCQTTNEFETIKKYVFNIPLLYKPFKLSLLIYERNPDCFGSRNWVLLFPQKIKNASIRYKYY